MALYWKFGGAFLKGRAAILHVVAATGLLIGIGAAGAQSLSPETQDALQRGIAAARQQQWLIAQSNFENAFKLAPEAPEVLFNLGLLNDGMGRELRAAAWYRAYLATAPASQSRTQIVARITALEEQAREGARKLVERAATANNHLPPNNRGYGLSLIVSAQVQLGDVQAAFASAASTSTFSTEPASLAHSYNALAASCAGAGELSCIDQAVSRIGDVDARMRTLHGVVMSLPSSFLREAAAYASHVQGRNRVYAYLSLADKQFHAGDTNALGQSLATAMQLLEAQPKQENASDLYTRLIKLLCATGDIETAKRLISQGRVETSTYYFPNALGYLAQALIKADRLDEAEAIASRISPYVGVRGGILEDIHPRNHAISAINSSRIRHINELISANKLAEAEALLAKNAGRLLSPRLALAKAYLATGNYPAAGRSIDAAAKVAAAIQSEDWQKWSTLNTVAEAYAELATSELYLNLAAAKVSATKAIKLTSQIKDERYRGSALWKLGGELIFRTGLGNEVSKLALALSSTNSELVFRNLLVAYTLAGQRSQVTALLTKIKDPSARGGMLAKEAVVRAQAADWTAALGLAAGIEDLPKAREAYGEIATAMLQAGHFKEAIALEPKLAGAASESTYLSYLSSYLAQNGEFDAATRAALRQAPIYRVDYLMSVARTAVKLAGPQATLPMLDQVLAQIANIQQPVERARWLCATSKGWPGREALDPRIFQSLATQCINAMAQVTSAKDRVSVLLYTGPITRHWLGAAVADVADPNTDAQPCAKSGGCNDQRWRYRSGACDPPAVSQLTMLLTITEPPYFA